MNDKIQLAPYKGEIIGLKVEINEFQHHLKYFYKDVRNSLKNDLVDNLESRILIIISGALNGEIYDKRWLAANIQEISNLFLQFDNFRILAKFPRIKEKTVWIDQIKLCLQNTRQEYFHNKAVKEAAGRSGGSVAAAVTGATAATATGLSAFSFFGGPFVGIPVTASFAVAGIAATAVATKVAYDSAYDTAGKELEDAIRFEYR